MMNNFARHLPHGVLLLMTALSFVVVPVSAFSETTPKQHTYTVTAGRVNSLWRIAEREYGGRAELWPLIAKANDLEYPYIIHVGDELIIEDCRCDLTASLPKPVTQQAKAEMVKSEVSQNTVTLVTPPAPPLERVDLKDLTLIPENLAFPVEPQVSAGSARVAVREGVITPVPAATPEVAAVAKVDVPDLPIYSPGSAWNSFGTSPLESGNWVNYSHVDQGHILGWVGGVKFEPYVALNSTNDTLGYSWNNKVKAEAGMKIAKPFRLGVLEVGGAYAVESRQNTPKETRSGFIGFADGWFGWDQPTSQSSDGGFFRSKPGSGQFMVGNVSPFEKNNVISVARVEQGVSLTKVGRISLIPQGWGQAGADTQGQPWNNRLIYGGGLKVVIPWNTGTLNLVGGYECAKERSRASSSRASSLCGPTVKMDIWTGWRKGWR